MKTDDLVNLLATGLTPVPRHATAQRLALALAVGLAAGLALLLLGYGIRPDLAEAAGLPMFWVKLLVPVAIGGAGLLATHRLARPGVPAGLSWLGVLLSGAGLWGLAAMVCQATPGPARPALPWGRTWTTRALGISAFPFPTFPGAPLAPARPG